jgi:hypothetical protein
MGLSPWVAVDAATIPATRARELRDAWEDFVDARPHDADDDPGTPEIRQPIVESWKRSRDAGVDPIGRQVAPSLVALDEVQDRWAAHPLASADDLIAYCMAEAAAEADDLLVVADADGMLLSVRGDTRMRSRAFDDMNFVEGALWSEAGAGTNAVGTAVAAGHAVQVFAAEHFTEAVHRWTCAASPVIDPDTRSLLGIIDLTGDISGVNPHSLSLVVATARAIEELLRGRMHEHDDRLRGRYGALLGPPSAGAALITGTGRIVLDPGGRWPSETIVPIPAGGGQIILPSGDEAIAEPVDDHDAYVVRPARSASRPARPHLMLRVLGDGPAEVEVDHEVVPLRRRHVEMLALIVLHRGRLNTEIMCAQLYGDDGHPASIRVEMSRLRRLLPGALDATGYRLTCDVESDVWHVRALLRRNDVCAAAQAYPGPLLPESDAPGIRRERDELDAWLREAVVTSEDADALWAWVSSPSGADDLLAWQRLVRALKYTDARRSQAVARLAALRRSLAL